MVLKYRHQVDTVVGVRVSQTNEVQLFAGNNLADVRANRVGGRMGVNETKTTQRKSDDDGVTNSRLVKINPESWQIP